MSEEQEVIEGIVNDLIGKTPKAAVRSVLSNILKVIADDIYSEDNHFILEVLQNAEDNNYAPSVIPSLTLNLQKHDFTNTPNSEGLLLLVNNEVGFAKANVQAICNVGGSTKVNDASKIGEKGIGFKSVFKVCDRPHIVSNNFRFYLSSTPDSEIGVPFIIPRWLTLSAEALYSYTDQTLIALPLKLDKFEYVAKQLSIISPETILFLRKIQQLTINVPGLEEMKCTKDESEAPLITLDKPGLRKWFYKVSTEVTVPPDVSEEKRKNIASDTISVVFPLFSKGDTDPQRIQCDTAEGEVNVYAYLPTVMYSGLPFYINANFVQPASREFIMSPDNSQWNSWLIDRIPSAWWNAYSQLLREQDNDLFRLAYKYIPLLGMRPRSEVRIEQQSNSEVASWEPRKRFALDTEGYQLPHDHYESDDFGEEPEFMETSEDEPEDLAVKIRRALLGDEQEQPSARKLPDLKSWVHEGEVAVMGDDEELVEVEVDHSHEDMQAQIDFAVVARSIRAMLRRGFLTCVRCLCGQFHPADGEIRIVPPEFLAIIFQEVQDVSSYCRLIHIVDAPLAFQAHLKAIGVKSLSVLELITFYLQEPSFYHNRQPRWYVGLYKYLSTLTYHREDRLAVVNQATRAELLPTFIEGNKDVADLELVYFPPSADVVIQQAELNTYGYCFLIRDISSILRSDENVQALQWVEKVFNIKKFSMQKHKKQILKILYEQIGGPTISIQRMIELTRTLFNCFQEDNMPIEIPLFITKSNQIIPYPLGDNKKILLPACLSQLWPFLFEDKLLKGYHILSNEYIKKDDNTEKWKAFLQTVFHAREDPSAEVELEGDAVEPILKKLIDEKIQKEEKSRSVVSNLKVTTNIPFEWLSQHYAFTADTVQRARCLVKWIHQTVSGSFKMWNEFLRTHFVYDVIRPSKKVCRHWLAGSCRNEAEMCKYAHKDIRENTRGMASVNTSLMLLKLQTCSWVPTTKNTFSPISDVILDTPSNKSLYGDLFSYPCISITDKAAKYLELLETPSISMLCSLLITGNIKDVAVVGNIYKGLDMKPDAEKEHIKLIAQTKPLIFNPAKKTYGMKNNYTVFDNDAATVSNQGFVYLLNFYDETLESFFVNCLQVKRRISYKILIKNIPTGSAERFEYFLKLVPVLHARYSGNVKMGLAASLQNIAVKHPNLAYIPPSRCIWEDLADCFTDSSFFGFLSINYPVTLRDFFVKTLKIRETFQPDQLLAALQELSDNDSEDFTLVYGIYRALAKLPKSPEVKAKFFSSNLILLRPTANSSHKWVSGMNCTWDDYTKDFFGEFHWIASEFRDFDDFFLRVVEIPRDPTLQQLVSLWKAKADQDMLSDHKIYTKNQICKITTNIYRQMWTCRTMASYLEGVRKNQQHFFVWTTTNQFMDARSTIYLLDDDVPPLFSSNNLPFVFRGNMTTRQYGTFCDALGSKYAMDSLKANVKASEAKPRHPIWATKEMRNAFFARIYVVYPNVLAVSKFQMQLKAFMEMEEWMASKVELMYELLGSTAKAPPLDTHYRPGSKKSILYITRKTSKHTAAETLSRFVNQMFWSVLMPETEDWFAWFFTHLCYNDKQQVRDFKELKISIEDLNAAISRLLGVRFEGVQKITSNVVPHAPPVVVNTNDNDADMDDAPEQQTEATAKAPKEKQFRVAYPSLEESENQTTDAKDGDETKETHNPEGNQTPQQKRKSSGGQARSLHDGEPKFPKSRDGPPPNLAVTAFDKPVLMSIIPEDVINKIKSMERQKQRVTRPAKTIGRHLVSRKEQLAEENSDSDGEEKVRIVVKHNVTWERGVSLSADEFKLLQDSRKGTAVLYVVTDAGEVNVFEDMMSLLTWVSIPLNWGTAVQL